MMSYPHFELTPAEHFSMINNRKFEISREIAGTGATNAKSQIPNDRYSSPQRRKERKVLIIFRKSAPLFFAVLPVRRYFGRINGKEEKKHLCVLRVSAVKKIGYFRFIRVR